MLVLPVHRVCSLLRESLESDPRFNDLYLTGEVSNLLRSSAGHIYFTLKDAGGQLRCAFFRRANALNLPNWNDAKPILNDYQRFNTIISKAAYSGSDKTTLAKIIKDYGLADRRPAKTDYFVLQEVRGRLFAYKSKKVTISVDGRADWDGWLELQATDVDRAATENTARVVQAVNADVLAVVEAEDRAALARFNDQLLKRFNVNYPHYMLIDGNDERGIDVGFYSRVPVGQMRSNVDAGLPGGRIFSRDCPEYEMQLPSGKSLWLLVNHLKSKGFGTQAANDKRREDQAKEVARIYQTRHANHEFVAILGDFNDTPDSVPLAPLLTGTNLKDVMTHPAYTAKPGVRPGTFKTGSASNKIDYILLNPGLWAAVQDVDVERRGVFTKTVFPHFPEVTSEITAASDHAAVWVDLAV